MTRTKSAKALLVALLSLAIVIAFMPAMAQNSYAASKLKVSPSKKTISVKKTVKLTAKGLSAKQLKKVKWSTTTAGKKVVKLSASKGKTIKVTGKKAGKATITAKYGKKKAKATITVKAAATKTTVASVAIDKTSPKVGDTLTATLADKDGKAVTADATYQWYRVNQATGVANEIAGATLATYKVVAADYNISGYTIYVVATVSGKTVKSAPTAVVSSGYTASLSDAAPYVGETVKAELKNAVTGIAEDEGLTYQWYVNGEALRSATTNTFAVTADELGKTIECAITINGEEYKTGASKAVVAATIPTAMTISGASGVGTDTVSGDTTTTTAVPAVGDTLTATFSAPANAADDKATYQWYRGEMALAGQTSATYTVEAKDAGSTIKCVATLSSKDAKYPALTAITGKVVANKLSSAKYTAALVDNKDAKNTTFTTNTTLKAIVYETADTKATDIYSTVAGSVKWYIDSVADANQLYSNESTAVSAQTLDLNGSYGTKTGTTYKALDSLAGHSIIAVVVGNGTSYAGTVTTAAVGPVGIKISGLNLAKNGSDAMNNVVVGKTSIKASFTDAKTTATYQWYKSTDNGKNYAAIAGATSATYAPTAQDAYDKVNMYKVIATGNGSYVGSVEKATSAITFADETSAVAVNVTIGDKDGKALTGTSVRPGDVLTAKASVDAAEANMTYTWTYTDVSKAAPNTTETTGATYTVPADADADDTIELKATNTDTKYSISVKSGKLTIVNATIKSVTLTSAVSSSDATKADPKNPLVGNVLTASVDPKNSADVKWYYSDDTKLEKSLGTGATYEVKAADLGKTIVAVATGTGDYTGSTAQASTGEVKVKVSVKATYTRDGQTADINNDTQLKIGDVITVTTGAYDSNATWTWTTNGSTAADKATYTIQNSDSLSGAKKISVKAAGPFTSDSSLEWSYDGVINQ